VKGSGDDKLKDVAKAVIRVGEGRGFIVEATRRYKIDGKRWSATDRYVICRNLDPSCQTLSDLDGLEMAGGRSGLGSQSRPIRWLSATAGISQEET